MRLSTIVLDLEESSCVVIPDTVSSTLELELGALQCSIRCAYSKFIIKCGNIQVIKLAKTTTLTLKACMQLSKSHIYGYLINCIHAFNVNVVVFAS